MSKTRFLILTSFIILSFAFQKQTLAAGNSHKKQCAKYKIARQELVKLGVIKNMNKGADWAKQNLDEKALKNIKDFIDISEQLIFLCGSKTLLVANDVYGRKQEINIRDDIEAQDNKYRKVPLPIRRPKVAISKVARVKKAEVTKKDFFEFE